MSTVWPTRAQPGLSCGSFVGDMPFAIAALLMAFDFIVKLGPLFPTLTERLTTRYRPGVAN